MQIPGNDALALPRDASASTLTQPGFFPLPAGLAHLPPGLHLIQGLSPSPRCPSIQPLLASPLGHSRGLASNNLGLLHPYNSNQLILPRSTNIY